MDGDVIVPPANEEERACFGEILPLHPLQSRKARNKKITNTVDVVAAGREHFATLEEVMRNLDSTFKGAAPVLRISKVSSNTKKIISALCRSVQALSFDEEEAIRKQYLDNLMLSKKHYEESRDLLFPQTRASSEDETSPHIEKSRTSNFRFDEAPQPFSLQTIRELPDVSGNSTQSSLLSCPLPIISSWSATTESLSSLTTCGPEIGDFPENFISERDTSSSSSEGDLSLTPPPPRRQRLCVQSVTAQKVTADSTKGRSDHVEIFESGSRAVSYVKEEPQNSETANSFTEKQKLKHQKTPRKQPVKRKSSSREKVLKERLRPVLPRKAKQNKKTG